MLAWGLNVFGYWLIKGKNFIILDLNIMHKKIDYPPIAKIVLSCTAVFAFIMLGLFLFKIHPVNTSYDIDPSIFANYGGTVGALAAGALSFVSIIMIIKSLNAQQEYYMRIEAEQRVFEFVHLYRENVDQAAVEYYHGRNMFIMIRNEILETYAIVSKLLNDEAYFKSKYKNNITMVKIDISFLLVFYGLGEHTDDYLRLSIADYCEPEKVKMIFDEVSKKHLEAKSKYEKNKSKNINELIYVPYCGHQSRLGHYFRSLFQAVNYINKLPDKIFSIDVKYEYVKMLRTQMSDHELAVFFFNSVSRLGCAWELSKETEEEKLITRYRMLKNIPFGFTGEVFPKEFYPNITYEETNLSLS